MCAEYITRTPQGSGKLLAKKQTSFCELQIFRKYLPVFKIPKTSLGSMGFDYYEIYSSDHSSVAKIRSAEFTENLRNSSFKNSAKVYGEFFC